LIVIGYFAYLKLPDNSQYRGYTQPLRIRGKGYISSIAVGNKLSIVVSYVSVVLAQVFAVVEVNDVNVGVKLPDRQLKLFVNP